MGASQPTSRPESSARQRARTAAPPGPTIVPVQCMASSSSSRRAAGWLCLVCLVSTAAGVEPHVRVAMQTGRALRRNSKTLKGIFGEFLLFPLPVTMKASCT